MSDNEIRIGETAAPGSDGRSRLNLRSLLQEMIDKEASDLHVTAGERPKMRVDGEIADTSVDHIMTPKDTLQLAYSVLTEAQKKRFELEDELDFSFGIQNLARFRGNVFKQRGCVAMVLRMIPFQVRTFQDLGLPPVMARLSERPRGLILITGPTGSGKSTTLAAVIDKINKERRGHIITVEDPIEFIHRHQNCIVNQREVGTDTKSFSNALKYALRENQRWLPPSVTEARTNCSAGSPARLSNLPIVQRTSANCVLLRLKQSSQTGQCSRFCRTVACSNF